jgi:hypothetical protein
VHARPLDLVRGCESRSTGLNVTGSIGYNSAMLRAPTNSPLLYCPCLIHDSDITCWIYTSLTTRNWFSPHGRLLLRPPALPRPPREWTWTADNFERPFPSTGINDWHPSNTTYGEYTCPSVSQGGSFYPMEVDQLFDMDVEELFNSQYSDLQVVYALPFVSSVSRGS